MNIIENLKSKTVTIIGDSGLVVEATASVHLNICYRKDGGVTVWYDGRRKADTVRVDSTGALLPNRAKRRRRKA